MIVFTATMTKFVRRLCYACYDRPDFYLYFEGRADRRMTNIGRDEPSACCHLLADEPGSDIARQMCTKIAQGLAVS